MKANQQSRLEILGCIDRGELNLPTAVRQLRRSTGKSQRDFAKLIGVSARSLIELEQGRGNPTLKTITRILQVFGLELSVKRRPQESITHLGK